ncbi:hypothetical protein [Terracidiphilus gabretensis]|uniref:hypothetical protein n=1 Tax=Terracidiphilus gabretensis TaxID=1577687 RepID=UPI00071B2D56|nr:hypothetical protein [Terracidiphilus gabretensis]
MGTWSVGGNALGNASQGNLGTTDSNALVLETAGLERARIDPSGNVYIGIANPAAEIAMLAQTTFRVDSPEIYLSLTPNGGGQIRIANNQNDNKIYIEGMSSDGSTSAAEMLLTGALGSTLPQLSLMANATVLSGNLYVSGKIYTAGGVSYEEQFKASEKRLQSLEDELALMQAALAEARAHS